MQSVWELNKKIMIPKEWCLFVYFILVSSPWACLYLRTVKQRKIVKQSAPLFLESEERDKWNQTYDNMVFGNIKRMRLILNNQDILNPDIKKECTQYINLSRIIYTLVGALIVFAFVAHKICK